MKKIVFFPGEIVRHRKKTEWGIGKIIDVNRSGTVGVIFEGNRILSIVKGEKYLIKVDRQDNEI